MPKKTPRGKRFGDPDGPKPGRTPGAVNKITMAAKELAEGILDDAYMAQLKERVLAGKAPHMETLLWQYAKGKPKGDDEGGNRQTLIQIMNVLGTLPVDTLRSLRDAMATVPQITEGERE